jgi:hypothetical protein
MLFRQLGHVLLPIFLVLQNARCNAAVQPSFWIQPGTDRARLNDLKQAFKDAIREARLVAATFSDCEAPFLRYFEKSHAQFVRDVFRTIANIPVNADINKDNVQQYLPPSNWDLNSAFSKLPISLGNHPGLSQADLALTSCSTKSSSGTGEDAFIVERQDGTALVSLCDEVFDYPSLDTIANPPAALRDPPPANTPFIGYTCDRLGDHDTDWLLSPGGILLHEFIHWTYLLQNVPRYHDLIKGPNIGDYFGDNPSDGYGPFNAEQLLFFSTKWVPGKFRKNEVLQNADNYAWYAHSKYWSFICGRTFSEAKAPEDFSRRTPVPRILNPGNGPHSSPIFRIKDPGDDLLTGAVVAHSPLRKLSNRRRRTRKANDMRIRMENQVSAVNESLKSN